MTSEANLPEPTARAEVARYSAWPTQASSYLTGCLEILAIRERYLAARCGQRHGGPPRLPRPSRRQRRASSRARRAGAPRRRVTGRRARPPPGRADVYTGGAAQRTRARRE